MYICMYMYVYIYIYIERERDVYTYILNRACRSRPDTLN